MAVTRDEVLTFLKKWTGAYEAGSQAFFDGFAADASFFTPSSVTRVDGLEEYKRLFGPQLAGGATRKSQLLSPEIRILGDAAVASYHNRVQVDGRVVNLRVSVTVSKDNQGNLSIVHFHSSPLDTPRVIVGPGADVSAISLLEERVATAAAAVGTPK